VTFIVGERRPDPFHWGVPLTVFRCNRTFGSLSLATVIGAFAARAQQTPIMAGAAQPNRSGDICISVPDERLDWHAVAVNALGEKAVVSPNPDTVRKHYIQEWGTSSRYFTAPAPASVRQTVVVLHDKGVVEVQLTYLQGTMEHQVATDSVTIKRSTFSGQTCGKAPGAKVDPAFYLTGERLADWVSTPGPVPRLLRDNRANGGENDFAVTIGGAHYGFTEMYLKSASSRLFRRGNATLLMIIWPSDVVESSCNHYYSLYEVGAPGSLRLINKSANGCED
jgi:hypothetical protein